MRTTTTLLAATVLAAGAALAQEAADDGMAGMDHAAMGHDGAMGEMMTAMAAMMAAMPAESTGTVDADFLLMMIPHHQSAIDRARVELAQEQGQDEATKAMAQEIIDAQEAEIAEMRAMLEAMGVQPPVAPAERGPCRHGFMPSCCRSPWRAAPPRRPRGSSSSGAARSTGSTARAATAPSWRASPAGGARARTALGPRRPTRPRATLGTTPTPCCSTT